MKNVIALTYPHVTQRTLFLRTGDWSWGQVPWVTSTQPKISIEIGCCASIAKKANTLYQLSKDTSTITPMSALCYWHIHTRLFSPTSRSSPRTNIPGFPGMFCNLQWIFHWIILSTIDLVGLNLAQLHSHCVGVTAEILSQTRLFSSPPLEKESNRNSYFERAISVVMIMNQTFPALQALSQTRLAVKLPADMQEKVIFFFPLRPKKLSKQQHLGAKSHGCPVQSYGSAQHSSLLTRRKRLKWNLCRNPRNHLFFSPT